MITINISEHYTARSTMKGRGLILKAGDETYTKGINSGESVGGRRVLYKCLGLGENCIFFQTFHNEMQTQVIVSA